MEVYLTVAKRIVLYLARAAPQQTIDHLATEAARLLNEADDPLPAAAAAAAAAADDHADHASPCFLTASKNDPSSTLSFKKLIELGLFTFTKPQWGACSVLLDHASG